MTTSSPVLQAPRPLRADVNAPTKEYHLTDRGFFSRGVAKEIDELYEAQLNGSENIESWEYRRRVLMVACRAIGNLREWYKKHSGNPYVYGRRYDFLVDTLTFIRTGKRELCITGWMGLLEACPSPNEYEATRLPKLPYPVVNTTPELVARWCQQPDGFTDMLCSLNILSGSREIFVD